MLKRIAVIFLAFLISSAAAGLAIAVALLGPDWRAVVTETGQFASFLVLTVFAAGFSGAVNILPLFLVVIAAEVFRLRSFLLYSVAGAAAMVFAYFRSGFAERVDAAAAHLPVGQEAAIAAGAGVVFGLVYWLLAGRKAGRWRARG